MTEQKVKQQRSLQTEHGQQPRCLMIENETNSHAVYWQNMRQTAKLNLLTETWGKQPRCLLTEYEANSQAEFTGRTLGKQPRCLLTEYEANSQA